MAQVIGYGIAAVQHETVGRELVAISVTALGLGPRIVRRSHLIAKIIGCGHAAVQHITLWSEVIAVSETITALAPEVMGWVGLLTKIVRHRIATV